MSKRLQQQKAEQIQDKNTLMNSMNNLISHISLSRKNQQQMFGNLSRKDFDKIVANFEDQLLKLRLTTAQLLTQLLFSNNNLKKKFCALMDIHFCQNSNIVLNNNLNKIFQKYPTKFAQIFILLKSYSKLSTWPIPNQNKRLLQPLFWFINPKKDNLTIQYIYREDIVSLIQSATNNLSAGSIAGFDPLQCIFGVNLSSSEQPYSTDLSVTATQTIHSDANKSRSINNKNNQLPSRRQTNNSFTPKSTNVSANYGPQLSARNTLPNNSFLRQNNRQQPQIYIRQDLQPKKNNFIQMGNKTMIDERILQSSIQTQYPNNSTIFQIQSHSNTESKKENEGRFSLGQKDKYSNRLSLQMHELRGNKKNGAIDGQLTSRPQASKKQPSKFQQHHAGIQLITPRQSWKNGNKPKIQIVNSGHKTDRLNTQKPASSRHQKTMNDSINSLTSTQRIKTIHLGRGSKGWETAREKKNIKLQSN